MALCPGFTKTEFHQRMQVKRGDGFMWLDADFLVRTSLEDFEKGRAYSIPGAQYKAIRALTTAIPNRVAAAHAGHGPPVTVRIAPPLVGDAEQLADLHLDVWEEAYADLMPASVFADRRSRRDERVASWSGIIANGSSDNLLAWSPTAGCWASRAPAVAATPTTASLRSS